jgi:hypothetical protein
MMEKHSQKLKAKGKGSTAQSKAKKSNPKRRASGGPTGLVSQKGRSENVRISFVDISMMVT